MCTWLTSELCPGAEAFTVAPPAAVPVMALPAVTLAPGVALLGADVLGGRLLAAFPPAAGVEAAVAEDDRGAAGASAACTGAFFCFAAGAFLFANDLWPP